MRLCERLVEAGQELFRAPLGPGAFNDLLQPASRRLTYRLGCLRSGGEQFPVVRNTFADFVITRGHGAMVHDLADRGLGMRVAPALA